MNALRIKALGTCEPVKFAQNAGPGFRRVDRAHHPKPIAAIRYLHAETPLNLTQVLVELAAKVCQQPIIERFQQDLLSFGIRTQAARAGFCNRPRNEFRKASEISTSTKEPMSR